MRSYLEQIKLNFKQPINAFATVWKVFFYETIGGVEYCYSDIYARYEEPSNDWLDAIEQCAINSFKRVKP